MIKIEKKDKQGRSENRIKENKSSKIVTEMKHNHVKNNENSENK